ncbi:hypothetical protein [Roseateles noduli]|uniref:hypothetical protein n=1 Tax=Roseateles noduli TaxID=2052484 RepID=UPI003D658E25
MWEVAVGDDIWVGDGWHREFDTGRLVVTDEDAYRRYLEEYRPTREEAGLIIPPHFFADHEVAEGMTTSREVAEALDTLASIAKLPPEDVDLDRLLSGFSTAAVVLGPDGNTTDMLRKASDDDHREFVRRRQGHAAAWGLRLLEELDADSSQSELPGSTQDREQRARTLQQRLSDSPALLKEALPMAFFGSMLAFGIDHESPGGRRLLTLCKALKDDDLPSIAAALDHYEGRRNDGFLPRALADAVVSWRRLNAGRMQGLTHQMYDALELKVLASR